MVYIAQILYSNNYKISTICINYMYNIFFSSIEYWLVHIGSTNSIMVWYTDIDWYLLGLWELHEILDQTPNITKLGEEYKYIHNKKDAYIINDRQTDTKVLKDCGH